MATQPWAFIVWIPTNEITPKQKMINDREVFIPDF
jgi:hypothetical protein